MFSNELELKLLLARRNKLANSQKDNGNIINKIDREIRKKFENFLYK